MGELIRFLIEFSEGPALMAANKGDVVGRRRGLRLKYLMQAIVDRKLGRGVIPIDQQLSFIGRGHQRQFRNTALRVRCCGGDEVLPMFVPSANGGAVEQVT